MIITIIGAVAVGYVALMLLGAIVSIVFSIWMGDWKGCIRDFGFFVYLNSGVGFGGAAGIFVVGNILDFLMEGQFRVQIFEPNKIALIFLVFGIVCFFVGKELKRDREMEARQKSLYGQK